MKRDRLRGCVKLNVNCCVSHLIDYPLYKVKLSFQRRVKQQGKWVELHS